MDYYKRNLLIERFELLESGKCYPSSSNISLRSQLYSEKLPITTLSVLKCSLPPLEITKNLSKFEKVNPDEKYGPSWSIFWFKIDIEIPETWLKPENEIHFLWDSDNEALLFNYNCTKVLQGFSGDGDYNKRAEYIIKKLPEKDDLNDENTTEHQNINKITYFLEMSCNNLFGNGPFLGPKDKNSTYSIKTCSVALFNRQAWDLLCDFIILKDSAAELDRVQQNRADSAINSANKIMDIVIPADISTYPQAQNLAKNFLNCKNSSSQHQVYAMGHCHIDTAWLWNFEATRRKTARSWSAQLELMKFYKDYKFSASQAQQYSWLKNDYPSLFKEIQAKAKENRFIPVGGTWVEFDGNIPSGESMVRQFLYGQYFFKENFGEFCQIFFMPDTFGYSPQLPQIMKEAHISNFLTQKLSWNLVNKFPHNNFLWKGIDGTCVLAHFPPADTYTSRGNLGDVLKSQTNFQGKDKSNCSVLLFGNGDGGGGPKMDYIESLKRMEDLEGVPKVKFENLNEFFKELRKSSDELNVWDGELYLELHNGTYTTMAENKKCNRKFEMSFRDCEILLLLSILKKRAEKQDLKGDIDFYHNEFKDLWKLLLLDQFHDVLPGTSVKEVYEDTHRHFVKIRKELNSKIDELIDEIGIKKENEGISGYYFFNSLNYDIDHYFEMNEKEGFIKIAPYSLSFVNETKFVNQENEKQVFVKEEAEFYEITNKFLIIKISKTGIILSIKDKRTMLYSNEKTMKEVIQTGNNHYSGGNCLLIHNDIPFFYDAWDIFPYYKNNQTEILAYNSKITKNSIHQINILFKYRVDMCSIISQTVRIFSNSAKIDFVNEIQWHQTRKLLRVYFPLNIRTDSATFDIQNGVLKRATHNNTSWDAAKHEVYGHKFADLSESNFGVSLLNDCKYGYSAKENVLGLSLLKSSKLPNEEADMGVHMFVYSLFVHEGNKLEETLKEAEILNEEMVVKKGVGDDFCYKFVKIDKKNVILDCLKPSEIGDFVVLRVHEHLGEETCFNVCLEGLGSLGVVKNGMEVRSVDVLEIEKEVQEEREIILGVDEGSFIARIKAFQILTFKINFKI